MAAPIRCWPIWRSRRSRPIIWLTAGEMLDGLGLAETTPGPLILVTEFVGFLAGFRHGGEPKLAFGLLGAAVTLWATFAPCFLWIFVGAPYVERLTSSPKIAGALAGVTAAVVGVILNLSLWFALHVFFGTRRADLPSARCSFLARPRDPQYRSGRARLLGRVPALRLACRDRSARSRSARSRRSPGITRSSAGPRDSTNGARTQVPRPPVCTLRERRLDMGVSAGVDRRERRAHMRRRHSRDSSGGAS